MQSIGDESVGAGNYNSAAQADRSVDLGSNEGSYFNPYDEAGIAQRNELQEIHDEREAQLAKRKKE